MHDLGVSAFALPDHVGLKNTCLLGPFGDPKGPISRKSGLCFVAISGCQFLCDVS